MEVYYVPAHIGIESKKIPYKGAKVAAENLGIRRTSEHSTLLVLINQTITKKK